MTINREDFAMRSRTMPEHMANLDKLVPATLRGAHMAVLEITDAVQVDARRGEDKRTGKPVFETAVVLRYKEIPNRIHWLNKAGVNILCDVFGSEESEWVGRRIPVIVKENVKNPTAGGRDDMVWVANADEWPRLFEEWDAALQKKPTERVEAINSGAAAAAREASSKRSTSPATSPTPKKGDKSA